MAFALSACGGEAPQTYGESESAMVASAPGFYAFDGTWMHADDQTIVAQLAKKFAGRSFYFEGVQGVLGGAFGAGSASIGDRAIAQICDDVRAHRVSDVYILGASRGALTALYVAHRAQAACKARIRWIGLLDAVDTMMGLSYPRFAPPPPARTVHLVKFEKSAGIYSTAEISGAAVYVARRGLDHSDLQWDGGVLSFFQASARGSGAPF